MSEELFNRNDILARVTKLLSYNTANGCTEAEMQAAAAKAQSLMTRYNLSMAEIEVAEGKLNEEYTVERDVWNNYPGGGTSLTWRRSLLVTLCQFNFCESQFWRTQVNANLFQMVGQPHNIQMVKYLLAYLNRQMLTLSRDALKDAQEAESLSARVHPDRWRSSYLLGMVQGIHNRLQAQFNTDTTAEAGSTALVVVKEQELQEAVERLVGKLKVKSLTVRSGSVQGSAYGRGMDDADKVSLDRPLSETHAPKQLGEGQ